MRWRGGRATDLRIEARAVKQSIRGKFSASVGREIVSPVGEMDPGRRRDYRSAARPHADSGIQEDR